MWIYAHLYRRQDFFERSSLVFVRLPFVLSNLLPAILQMKTITDFTSRHYRHFNAATLKDAAQGYQRHLEKGGKMLVTVAGAMSTAELGLSLAEMIRQGKIHPICCTVANLEKDSFKL